MVHIILHSIEFFEAGRMVSVFVESPTRRRTQVGILTLTEEEYEEFIDVMQKGTKANKKTKLEIVGRGD